MGVSQCVTPPCQTIRHPGVRYRMLLPNVRKDKEICNETKNCFVLSMQEERK